MGFIFALFTRSHVWAILLIYSYLIFGVARSSSASNDRAIQFTNLAYYQSPMRLDTMSEFSIEVWLRLDSSFQSGWPLSFGGDSAGFGLYLYENLIPGYPSPIMIASGYQHLSITGNSILMPLGGWVHVALTKDDTIWTLYRNGMLAGRGKLRISFLDSIFRIGRFSGALQQLRIWSFARTPEEIRADVYRVMADTEQGLYASFTIDTTSRDSIIDHVNGFVLKLYGSSTSVANIESSITLVKAHSPKVSWKILPSHLQFIPRNQSGYGTITISGSVLDAGFDSIVIDKSRDNQVETRFTFPLTYSSNAASFQIIDSFPAEPSLYSYIVFCERNDSLFYLAESADLVAGDVYIIDGQSNAHFAFGWFYWQVPYLRSFGVQTSNENFDPYDPADTLWGLANCSDWGESYTSLTGPYLTGVWGMHLQEDILNNFSIPVCVINGAAGSSTIEENARSDSNKEDLSTIYGKLLYRVQKANCQNDIKAILWDQGEFNTANNYYQNFKTLYQNWQVDYPSRNIRKTYVLQVRPGCGPPGGSGLREVQRTLPDSLTNLEVMSTVATEGHDGCHYNANGYVDIGDNVYRLLARDYYGSSDTSEINAPDIATAFYSLPDSSEVSFVIRDRDTSLLATSDTTIDQYRESLKDYFYLDGVSGIVRGVSIHQDTIRLGLSGPSKASYLTYLPDQNYNDTNIIYEGPWILNGRGIGMLSFNSVPILPYHPLELGIVGQTSSIGTIKSFEFRSDVGSALEFELSAPSSSTILIYDMLGRQVQINSFFASADNKYEVPIDRTLCHEGGVYMAVLRAKDVSRIVKLILF